MAKPNGIVEAFVTEPDVYAFRALAEGTATADQQKRVGNWLLTEACRIMQDPRTEVIDAGAPDIDAAVQFALGRRYVGILMRNMQTDRTLELAKKNTAALADGRRSQPAAGKPSTRERLLNTRGK